MRAGANAYPWSVGGGTLSDDRSPECGTLVETAVFRTWHRVHVGAPGPLGQLAKDRHVAVVQLFFSLLLELPTDVLLEIGAHNADASKRFAGAKQNARAVAYEAAPVDYERGRPEATPAIDHT